MAGLMLSELDWELHPPGPGEDPERPPVRDLIERFEADHQDWICEFWSEDGRLVSHWSSRAQDVWEEIYPFVPHDLLLHTFTIDEIVRLWYRGYLISPSTDAFRDHHIGRVIRRVAGGIFSWNSDKKSNGGDYGALVRGFQAIPRFSFYEGFEVKLDHTENEHYTDRGHALYSGPSVFLDASMAYVIHLDNKPVLIVGFSVIPTGVLVTQVQMVRNKGNRWLYKLPRSYLQLIIEGLHRAFGQVFLIDGASAVWMLRRSYSDPEHLPLELLQRVKRLYDQPINGWSRSPQTHRFEDLDFRLICPQEDRSVSTAPTPRHEKTEAVQAL